MKTLTTFPSLSEFEKAKLYMEKLSLPYEIISPGDAYVKVGVPAIVMEQSARSELYTDGNNSFLCSGWVDYHETTSHISNEISPRTFKHELMGTCSIMVLAPCMADVNKIRLTAHFFGDFTDVFPYLNTEMPHAMYNKDLPVFTFMESYRLVSLYSKRITIAKADHIVDAWRLLEKIRCLVNETWARKTEIQPSYEIKRKPPALEIYKRLPGSNCKECGEKTCMAFALRLWKGELKPEQCKPIFEGEYGHLKGAFQDICSGLGFFGSAYMNK